MDPNFQSNSVITLLTTPWFIVVVGGFIALGLALAWGMRKERRRSSMARSLRDAGTRRVYQEEERDRNHNSLDP